MLDDCLLLEKHLIITLNLNIKRISDIFNHPNESRFKSLFETNKAKKKEKRRVLIQKILCSALINELQ